MQFTLYKQSVTNSEASVLREQSLLLIHFIYNKFLSKHMHIPVLYIQWTRATQKYQQCKQYTQPKQNQSNGGILGQLNQHSYWKCFSVRKFWLESAIWNIQS